MRRVEREAVTDAVRRLCLEANYRLRPDVLDALRRAAASEESPLGRKTLIELVANVEIAGAEKIPICQDTGYVTVFIDMGQDVCPPEGLAEAVEQGVRLAYTEGYLRKSVVSRPLSARDNTGDNTPPFIHIEQVPGDRFRIVVMPKGGGSENAGALRMLPVAGGADAVRDFVLETAEKGALACPPLILGVAVGGSLDTAGLAAKKALLRPIEDLNADPHLAEFEAELLSAVNDLGIGPAGLGGRTTALAVKVTELPTHIACLPAAVGVSCYALRWAEASL